MPPYPNIRPKGRVEQTNEATNTPNQSSTPETTVSDPHTGPQKDPEKKKRKIPKDVVQNACLNCKRRRSKCDGDQPCSKCREKPTPSQECSYEPHVKYVKAELVDKLKSLNNWKHNAERIFQAIKVNSDVAGIIERIQNNDSNENIVQWLQTTSSDLQEPSSSRGSRQSTQDVESDIEINGVSTVGPSRMHRRRWSTVTAEEDILHHLFTLYFTWVHPCHTLFDERIFTESYTHNSGEFCTSALVNAICAMACCYHTAEDGDAVDYQLLGKSFADSAKLDLDYHDNALTTIQAFAIMFLVGCAEGKGLRASRYLVVANNSIANVGYSGNNNHRKVWRDTTRGIRSLNVEWQQMTFQSAPVVNPMSYRKYDRDHEMYDSQDDKLRWGFYRTPKDVQNANDLPYLSFTSTTNREKERLLDIIRDVEILLYTSNGPPIVARDILTVYGRFVTWRENLPSVIGDVGTEHTQLLPHILSLLILYHTAVVQLLRPLLDLEGFPTFLVDQVVWWHAQHGLYLLSEHYQTLNIYQYQPVIQMFAILQLVDVIARFYPHVSRECGKDGATAIQLAVEALIKSRPGCSVAGTLIELMYETAKDVLDPLSSELEDLFNRALTERSRFLLDDVIDACTRTTYTQPTHEIQSRFSPTMSSDWTSICAAFGFQSPSPNAFRLRQPSVEERAAQNLMQIGNLLNTE